MKKCVIGVFLLLLPISARADFWGGDLPLLTEIVTNTLNTLMELERQTSLMHDEMDGIKDKIYRIRTISDAVQPSTWDQWRDPAEALRRLKLVYYTLPKDYRSDKASAIESEISTAMNLVSRISPEAHTTFLSGKELEQKGADSSPGVAQKLTASGVGSLVAIEAQSQVIQSHITSLLAQILAEANERESREVVAKGRCFLSVSENLGEQDSRFSVHVLPIRVAR